MTIQEAVNLVLINGFAGGLVDYPEGFVEKSVPDCIQAAMTFCVKSAIREKRLAWFNWAKVIDVRDLNIKTTPLIFRAETNAVVGGESYDLKNTTNNDIFSMALLYGGGSGAGVGLNRFSEQFRKISTLQKMANTLGTDIGCRFNKAKGELYPFSNRPPKRFCIVYTPEFFTIEDVTDTDWQYLIVELATAMAKKVLGKALTSYVEKDALYKDAGEDYVAEGNAEYKEVMERIRLKGKKIIVKGN